ncbi:hypothetical protein BC826DRAFT_1109956 [Russula brevipes]|nr:hypothetical protein BC826DRAFT_1109956 [Russula brevipes]
MSSYKYGVPYITRRGSAEQEIHVSIHGFPDNVLLEIFDLYVDDGEYRDEHDVRNADTWHKLVHVCQRWRNLVSTSPRPLNLRLFCTERRPVDEMLEAWPKLPIILSNIWSSTRPSKSSDPDNIIAALEHSDRVCHINLVDVPSSLLEGFAAVMQMPFPELTYLRLHSPALLLADSFLAGSAQRLRTLHLASISFLGLEKLPLSASNLVHLDLVDFPHSAYVSPEGMVACLSQLTRLKEFKLGFQSPLSRPDQSSPLRPTRTILPALTHLSYHGHCDYLEDFVARINTPLLKNLFVDFVMDLIFDIPRVDKFISRAEALKPYNEVKLRFFGGLIQLWSRDPFGSVLAIRCNRIDWQISSIARICNWLSPLFRRVEKLDLIDHVPGFEPEGEDGMESMQFLELFQPYVAVQRLNICRMLVPLVAPTLRELTGMTTTAVLPELRELFLEGHQPYGPIWAAIQPFIAARQLSGHPVAVHRWERQGWDY